MSTPKETMPPLLMTEPWRNFILFCKHKFPHGKLTLQIVSGQPTKLLKMEQDIRFDQTNTIPGDVNFT